MLLGVLVQTAAGGPDAEEERTGHVTASTGALIEMA